MNSLLSIKAEVKVDTCLVVHGEWNDWKYKEQLCVDDDDEDGLDACPAVE